MTDGSDRAAHAENPSVQVRIVAPGPRPGSAAGGLGLDDCMFDLLRPHRLLRLHDGPCHPTSAARSPASIFTAASPSMPGAAPQTLVLIAAWA
jgi:hypothetical protein